MAAPTKPRPKRKTSASQQVNLRNARSTNWITAGVLFLYVLASIVSFAGLYEVAAWLHLWTWSHFAIPGFVDLGIIIYKFSEIKLRQDPTRTHLAWKAKAGVIAFTALSSGGNAFHVVSVGDSTEEVAFYGGIVFAAAAPWAIYLAATVLTDIVVKPKARKPKVKPVPKADMNRLRDELYREDTGWLHVPHGGADTPKPPARRRAPAKPKVEPPTNVSRETLPVEEPPSFEVTRPGDVVKAEPLGHW